MAKQIASTGEFGIAVSHLVLGSEELVKSMIIYFDGSGLNIRQVEGVKRFFHDHKSRHFIAAMFYMMTTVVKPFMKMVRRFHELFHAPEKRESMNPLETAIFNRDLIAVEKIADDWKETEGKELADQMKVQFDFWIDADEYKMKGFYVDFDDNLSSPGQITEEIFKVALITTDFFRQECLRLINYVQSLPETDKSELISTLNSDKTFYKTIKGMIDKSKGL